MSDVNILTGFETGDLGEVESSTGTVEVSSSTFRTGAFSLRTNPTTTGTGFVDLAEQAAGGGTVQFWRFYFLVAARPSANDEPFFVALSSSGTELFELRQDSAGQINVYLPTGGALQASGTTVLSLDQWYRLDVKFDLNAGAGSDDQVSVEIDGAAEHTNIEAAFGASASLGACRLGKVADRNGQGVDFFFDDVISGDAPGSVFFGAGQCIVRQPITGGTPTYDAWNKSSGSDVGPLWDDTPPDGATTEADASDTGANTRQTADIEDFDAAQAGHGSETIGASDTINAAAIIFSANRTNGSGKTMNSIDRRNSIDNEIQVDGSLAVAYQIHGPATSRAYGATPASETFANINIWQIGGNRVTSGAGRDFFITAVWAMVDYTPAPPSAFPIRSAQLNQAVKRASYF